MLTIESVTNEKAIMSLLQSIFIEGNTVYIKDLDVAISRSFNLMHIFDYKDISHENLHNNYILTLHKHCFKEDDKTDGTMAFCENFKVIMKEYDYDLSNFMKYLRELKPASLGDNTFLCFRMLTSYSK